MSTFSVKEQTVKSAKWNAFERFSVQGIQFVLTLLMARFLTPDDYGVVGMLAIFIAISQTFIESGFNSALVRTRQASEGDFCTVFYFNLVIAVVCYLLLYVTAPLIAAFFNRDILVHVLRIYSLSLIINSLVAVQVAMLQKKLDFKTLAKANVSSVLLSGLVGVILAYYGLGVWALVWQTLLASIISFLIIAYKCRWHPKANFSNESFKRLGSFGSRLLAAGLLDTIYKNMTSLAIGKFYTSADLGYYTRGSQFAQLPNNSINGVLSTVTYPILSNIQDDDKRLMNVYKRYIQISSMVIFIFSGILCALAKPLILLTLSDKWAGAIIYLSIFSLTCMFDHLSTINLNLLKVKGRSDLFLRLEILKKSISLLILFISIPFGVLSICMSKFLYNQIAVVCNSYYTGKVFNYGYMAQFKDFVPYLFKTVFACIPTYVLTLFELPNIITLFIGALMSILLYIMMNWRDENLKELILLIRTKL